MPKYRWIIEFDAEDDDDAEEQIKEAVDAFHSIHRDEVTVVEGDR